MSAPAQPPPAACTVADALSVAAQALLMGARRANADGRDEMFMYLHAIAHELFGVGLDEHRHHAFELMNGIEADDA